VLTPQPMPPKSNGTSAAQKTTVQLKNKNNSDCSTSKHSTVPTTVQKLAEKQWHQFQQHKKQWRSTKNNTRNATMPTTANTKGISNHSALPTTSNIKGTSNHSTLPKMPQDPASGSKTNITSTKNNGTNCHKQQNRWCNNASNSVTTPTTITQNKKQHP